MFDRFTDRARKVLGNARQEAQRFSHQYIGTEHFLLGLVQEGSGVAANVLRNFAVDPTKIRAEVEKIVKSSPTMVTMGQLPFTPRAKKVLELTSDEAVRFRHKYIGTEHLLLGGSRENEGVAAQVLMNLGLKLEDVREEILELIGVDHLPSPGAAAPYFDRYQEFTATTATYPGVGTRNDHAIVYCSLGLAGESGEVADKIKKLIRDKGGFEALTNMSDETRLSLAKETGDILWYVARFAKELGYSLSEIAEMNMKKLSSRKKRGTIRGSGDER